MKKKIIIIIIAFIVVAAISVYAYISTTNNSDDNGTSVEVQEPAAEEVKPAEEAGSYAVPTPEALSVG